MLPPVSVLTVAAFAHFSQEQAMEAAVKSYVQDLAESVAYRLAIGNRIWGLFPREYFMGVAHYRFFAWGLSIPGWVACIDEEGKVLFSSPGAGSIAAIWRQDLPIGTAIRVSDKEGNQYTMAIYPLTQLSQPLYQTGRYVVAAVSWDQLLGGLVRVGRLWPVLIVIMSLGSFWAIRLLWRRLIWPLKGLAAEIDGLRMGCDLPHTVDPKAVKEIESVHNALTRFAKAAIERDHIRTSYVRDIVKVQETERLEMAREIHDGPLQDITALLQHIHMLLEEGENSCERVQRTERLAMSVVRELRGLCDELAPPWVDLGLEDAMTELAERLSQTYDIHVSAEIEEPFELDSERTLSLLRIFQEAVSNAVRHGDATEVHACMFASSGRLFFEIQDNGQGFDAGIDHEVLRLEGHRGVANMIERMSLMGGSLEVRSKRGEGTCIRCVLDRKLLARKG
jgi:signal transduction histidine kinase